MKPQVVAVALEVVVVVVVAIEVVVVAAQGQIVARRSSHFSRSWNARLIYKPELSRSQLNLP